MSNGNATYRTYFCIRCGLLVDVAVTPPHIGSLRAGVAVVAAVPPAREELLCPRSTCRGQLKRDQQR